MKNELLHNESPALKSIPKMLSPMNTFNELEELEAFQHRLESARLRRRQLEEQRRQLENEYTSYDTPEKPTFKAKFCHFYHRRATRTTADIVEGVIGSNSHFKK
jgi:chromosome segregation ATPase